MITIKGNETEIKVFTSLACMGKLDESIECTIMHSDSGSELFGIKLLGIDVAFEVE